MKQTLTWLAICVGCVAGSEGLVVKDGLVQTYLDVGGVPTYCYGETKDAQAGRTYSPDECMKKLGIRIEQDFGPAVDRCVKHELPPKRKAAYVSLGYNIGVRNFCQSSVVKLENAGQPAAACEAILRYNKVRQDGVLVYSRGLNNRREKERALCLASLT